MNREGRGRAGEKPLAGERSGGLLPGRPSSGPWRRSHLRVGSWSPAPLGIPDRCCLELTSRGRRGTASAERLSQATQLPFPALPSSGRRTEQEQKNRAALQSPQTAVSQRERSCVAREAGQGHLSSLSESICIYRLARLWTFG